MKPVLNYGHLRLCYLYVYILRKKKKDDDDKLSYDLNSYYWRVVMIIKYNMTIMIMIVKAVIKKKLTCTMWLRGFFGKFFWWGGYKDCEVSSWKNFFFYSSSQVLKAHPQSAMNTIQLDQSSWQHLSTLKSLKYNQYVKDNTERYDNWVYCI